MRPSTANGSSMSEPAKRSLAVAHVLCELKLRLQAVGLVNDGTFTMPCRQTDIADAVGITAVHANRVIQELRGKGLIHRKERQSPFISGLTLPRWATSRPTICIFAKKSQAVTGWRSRSCLVSASIIGDLRARERARNRAARQLV